MESLVGIPMDLILPLGVILLTVVMGVLVVLTAIKNAKKEAAKQEKQW